MPGVLSASNSSASGTVSGQREEERRRTEDEEKGMVKPDFAGADAYTGRGVSGGFYGR